jgi:tetratricopeptide (TPR) repeat protein
MVSGSGDKTIRVWDIDKIGESESDVKGQDEFLMIACDRLRLHPVFVEAEPPAPDNKEAFEPVTVCRDKWTPKQEAEFDKQKARFHSQWYIQEGLKIAGDTGDLMQAQLKFDEARKLAPKFYDSLKDKPEEEAKIRASNFFVKEGDKLAEEGKVAEAIAKFKQVESLNLSLDFDPEERAKQIAVPSLITKAANLMRENNPSEGFAKYQQALALDPELTMTQGWDVNQLCWYGSLHGYGAEMMIVCDRAVEWVYYGFDSRGVARAMTGDYAGAIEDFQAFLDILNDLIQNTEGGGISQSLKVRKAQREAWIDALATGQNPFTEELVQELLKQPPFTFSFGR